MLDFGHYHHDITNAVIYARVSSQAQVKKGQGIQSQTSYCQQYAGWKSYKVHKVFQDSGITGSRADRDGIIAMLKFLKAEKHKKKRYVVIVDDISRLARDIRVHLDLRDAIDECKAVLESPSMTFGMDPDGRYFENMQALSAQHHREKNAEQTKKRQQARIIDGYWPFPAVIGYKHERISGHGKVMAPDEPLASIIREALMGYASGRFQTQAEVARFLENQQEFPKNRFGKVTIEAANRILNRVLYAGHVKADCWNIPLRKGKHEGLITLEIYQRIQSRLQSTVKIAARPDINKDFPLRGFVLCSDCGSPMTACWSKSKTGKKHPYYMCHKQGCPSRRKSIKRDEIEAAFEDILSNIQPSKNLTDVADAMFKKAWEIINEQEKESKQAIKQELHETEKKITTFLDRIVNAESTTVIQAYEQRITILEKDKLVLQEKLEKKTTKRRPFDEMFELAMRFLSNPWKVWELGTLEHKRTVLKLTFKDRLTYQRNQGFRTPNLSCIFKMLEGFYDGNFMMAETEGFEPSVPA